MFPGMNRVEEASFFQKYLLLNKPPLGSKYEYFAIRKSAFIRCDKMIFVDVFVESESIIIYTTTYFITLPLSCFFRTKKFERKSFLAEPKLPITYFKEAEDPSYQNLECYVPQEILSSVSFSIFSRKPEVKIELSCNTEVCQ